MTTDAELINILFHLGKPQKSNFFSGFKKVPIATKLKGGGEVRPWWPRH